MYKAFLFIMFISVFSQGQSLKTFLNLKTDEDKITFLNTKTELIEQEKILSDYAQKNIKIIDLLKKAGSDEQSKWSDTVLEGPYSLSGELDVSLTGIYKKNKTIYAFSGQVTQPALMTEDDSCIFDDEKEEYTGCAEGSIYQNFVIDIKGNLIESDNYPETDF